MDPAGFGRVELLSSRIILNGILRFVDMALAWQYFTVSMAGRVHRALESVVLPWLENLDDATPKRILLSIFLMLEAVWAEVMRMERRKPFVGCGKFVKRIW